VRSGLLLGLVGLLGLDVSQFLVLGLRLGAPI